jgi:DNA-binding MarR family transcriptional regulator
MTAAYADRLVSEGLAGAGARKWHYAVLAALAEAGPGSQAELSRRTGIYRSDLVAVITELADLGQVERAPDDADRRRNVVTLTSAGRRQLHRLDRLIAGVQESLLAPLSAAERDDLASLLRRLLEYHAGPDHPA